MDRKFKLFVRGTCVMNNVVMKKVKGGRKSS